MRVLSTTGLLLSLFVGLPTAATLADPSALQAFLRAQLRMSDAEWVAFDRGRPIVKSLPETMRREMTTAGGVRVQGTGLTKFVGQFKTLEGFRTSQFVQQLGRFSSTPVASDLDGLTLDPDDLEALESCEVGDCDVQLAAADIRRFKTEINWSAPDAAQKAAGLYRAVLFAHLTEYMAGGGNRLLRYNDRDTPVDLSTEMRALLEARPSPLDRTPEFRDYVRQFPGGSLDHTEDFFYWSKEAFGFKPVIGLNHVSVYEPEPGGLVMIATTQIYASHYMDALMSVSALVPAPGTDGADFYWVFVNRSRVGSLGGFLGAFARPIVQGRARAGLTRSLLQTKQRLEAGR